MPDEFLAKVSHALGSNQRDLIEAEVLEEIRRLRESAGELDREIPRVQIEQIEQIEVADVRKVHGSDEARFMMLLVETKARVFEQSHQSGDGPWTRELVEQGSRLISLLLPEPQVRELHAILDEKVTGLDLEE